MNVILFSLYCLLSYLSLVMLSLFLCECHLVFPLLSFVILINLLCYVCSYVNVILFSPYCLLSYLSLVMLSLLLCECHLVFPRLPIVILITCYVKFAPMWMSSCFPSIVFCHTYYLLCYVCSYVNVILFSLYRLLSYLSLVMLNLLLCECHLVFPSIVFCHTYHLLR